MVSVYVSPATKGRGVGKRILATLIERSEARNVWTLQVGKMSCGPMAGKWRDVLLLERRSARAGTD